MFCYETHYFADRFPFLHNRLNCWFSVFQIGKYPFLDGVILVIEVDAIFKSLRHDRLGDLEEDDFVRGLDLGHEELGLLHIGREPVYQEPGGRGHPCHGHGQQINYFILSQCSHSLNFLTRVMSLTSGASWPLVSVS